MAAVDIGGVEFDVSRCDETGRYEAGGGYRRVASGKLSDSSRNTLRIFALTTVFLNDTDYDALRAKVDLRTEQDIDGDLLDDVSKGYTRFLGSDYRNELDGSGGVDVTRTIRFELWESESA